MKRALSEFAATLAALGAVTVYLQLQDESSWLRTRLAEGWGEVQQARTRFRERTIRSRVDNLIHDVQQEG